MDVTDVKSLVRTELGQIHDASTRRRLEELLVTPHERDLAWEYAASDIRITCWIVGEDVQAGVQLVYWEEGFGAGDPWGVIRANDASAGRDDQWFASLGDAFMNSGLWHGQVPPGYEVR